MQTNRLVISLVVDNEEPVALRNKIKAGLTLTSEANLVYLGCRPYDSRFSKLAKLCHGLKNPTVVVAEFDVANSDGCVATRQSLKEQLATIANAVSEPETEVLPAPTLAADYFYGGYEAAAAYRQIVRHGPSFVR